MSGDEFADAREMGLEELSMMFVEDDKELIGAGEIRDFLRGVGKLFRKERLQKNANGWARALTSENIGVETHADMARVTQDVLREVKMPFADAKVVMMVLNGRTVRAGR